MIKLIASDIDGTLVNSEGKITPRVRQAIRNAVDAGCQVMLATGRFYRGMIKIQEELGLTVSVCSEINKLEGKIREKGLTLVPLQVYFKGSLVKVEIGLARGKKLYDKRAAMAERDSKREIDRALKARNRSY